MTVTIAVEHDGAAWCIWCHRCNIHVDRLEDEQDALEAADIHIQLAHRPTKEHP